MHCQLLNASWQKEQHSAGQREHPQESPIRDGQKHSSSMGISRACTAGHHEILEFFGKHFTSTLGVLHNLIMQE